jgi:hypothetical protein
MNRRQLWPQVTGLVAILVVCGVAGQSPAWAQTDGWSFVITPQVWISHISKNGFAAPGTLGIPIQDQNGVNQNAWKAGDSSSDSLSPQWGLQLAAQKGRWTLAGSFQYVTFETRTDVLYQPDNGACLSAVAGALCDGSAQPPKMFPGDRAAQEFVDTTRMDMDLAASYFFPDVTPWLDLSLGGGVKAIYATASREYGNLNPVVAAINGLEPPGLYVVCREEDAFLSPGSAFVASDCGFKDRVKTKTWLYGATVPMSAIFRLTTDNRWLLPLSITPFIGGETRDDQDVVYKVDNDFKVDRQDGTTFAYGVTADATVRWIINDTVSAYAGMRVQFIEGHEQYLAYGPLVGMSVRFGGK